MKSAIIGIVLCAVGLMSTVVLASGNPTPEGRFYTDVITALQGQVELLRWIGGAMVSGLAIAVVKLFMALMASQKETTVIADRSARANDKLADSIGQLHEQLKNRPCLKE